MKDDYALTYVSSNVIILILFWLITIFNTTDL